MNYQVHGNELYHHGILGQKWGVRRFQNPDGSLTPAGRERYGYGNGNGNKSGSQTSNKASSSSKQSHTKVSTNSDGSHASVGRARQNNSSLEIKGLTDNQKKALKVGATVVGVALASYGIYKLSNSETVKKFVNIGEGYVNKSFTNNSGNLNFLTDSSEAQILAKSCKTRDEFNDKVFDSLLSQRTPNFNINNVKKVSKDFLTQTVEEKSQTLENLNPEHGTKNCQAGTLAYIFNRRGLDVCARKVDTSTIDDDRLLKEVFKDFSGLKTHMPMDDANELEQDILKKYGNGAIGKISVKFNKDSGSHSMAFEVVNNSVIIIDSQARRPFTVDQMVSFMDVDLDYVRTARLDNLDLKDDASWLFNTLLKER